MSDLTRVWLTLSFPAPGLARDPSTEHEADLPSAAPIRALYVLRPVASGLEARRVSPSELPGAGVEHGDDPASPMGDTRPPPGEPLQSAQALYVVLDELARRYAGQQIALRADRVSLSQAVARALALNSFALPDLARNVVLDWPANDAPHLRCSLIGVDLDWSPPPPPKSAARFPGGPGSAASSKA